MSVLSDSICTIFCKDCRGLLQLRFAPELVGRLELDKIPLYGLWLSASDCPWWGEDAKRCGVEGPGMGEGVLLGELITLGECDQA